MTIEYYYKPRISLKCIYIITNETVLILSIFRERRSRYFPAKKKHVVSKIEIITAIVSQT